MRPWIAVLSRQPLGAAPLLTAIAYAVFAQGAFYSRQLQTLRVLVLVGAALALAAVPLRRRDLRYAPILACAGVAASALVSRVVHGGDAAAVASSMGLLAAVLLTLRRMDARHREVLAAGLLWVGAVVSLLSWVAVILRIEPLAAAGQGVWRAASTLTYANATAALLSALAAVALARIVSSPGSRWVRLVAFALVAGTATTLSRAGLLALVVAVALLAVFSGVRAACAATWPVAAGAAIALAGLIPSLPEHAKPRPAFAIAGLLAGGAVALAGPVLRGRRLAIVVFVGAAAVGVAMTVAAPAVHTLAAGRASVASQDRIDAWRAALHEAGRSPIVGVGPGRAQLRYVSADGRAMRARFAHNELLQVLVEQGILGITVVLLGLALTLRSIVRARNGTWLWTGAACGLCALGVQSMFDFVWHIPALTITGAALVGLATSPITKEER